MATRLATTVSTIAAAIDFHTNLEIGKECFKASAEVEIIRIPVLRVERKEKDLACRG